MANRFVDTSDIKMNQVDETLWEASCSLCEVIAGVIQGSGEADPKDSLAEREVFGGNTGRVHVRLWVLQVPTCSLQRRVKAPAHAR